MGEGLEVGNPMPPNAPTVLRMTGVAKTFDTPRGDVPVLADITLEVKQGEFVSLVGPSGCGKSTLLAIAAGIEEPTSGRVELFTANGAIESHRLGHAALMPQKDMLLPWRTALGNAVLGLEVQGIPAAAAKDRAAQMLSTFGLDGFAAEYPHNLSGGMRQRVALLRTLLAGKRLLLLDEPFGALDALTRASMQEWLLSLWSGLGRAGLMVTHDVEEALLLSHRVYVLTPRPGRVHRVIQVTLPWPRTPALVSTPEFTGLKASILSLLREPAGVHMQ